MSATGEELQPPRLVLSPEVRLQRLTNIDVDVNDAIPIKRYFRSSSEMIRMANYHLDEGNLEKSFQLYMKHVILYLEKLPKHVEYKKAEPTDVEACKKKCAQVIKLAEELKKKLQNKYRLQYEEYLKKKEIYDATLKARQAEEARRAELLRAQNEKNRKVTSDTFVSTLQSQIDRKKMELIEKRTKPFGEEDGENEEEEEEEVEHTDESSVVPSAPMAELSIDSNEVAGRTEHVQTPQQPLVDRSTKPAFDDNEADESGGGLTPLVIPFKKITSQFASLAYANTSRNIETCAILAGRLVRGRFVISHLMVPKQSGTADSCCAESEEELAFEQERLDLVTLGWIHTHPSQKAFLSSIDLHTHAPYQKMLPEAVAIVVAPSAHQTGLYSLSEWGLGFILACRQTGFHPHSNESDIYGEPSHVLLDDNGHVEVLDFR